MSKLFSIIAAIIHIGDIDFIEDTSDRHMAEYSKIDNFQQLQISKDWRELIENSIIIIMITMIMIIDIKFNLKCFSFCSVASLLRVNANDLSGALTTSSNVTRGRCG